MKTLNTITLATMGCLMALVSLAAADEVARERSPSQVQIVANGKRLTFAIVVTKRLKEGVLATVLHTTINTKGGGKPEGLPAAYAGRTIFVTGLSSMADVDHVWTNTFVYVGEVTAIDGSRLDKPVERWKVDASR